MGFGAVYCRRKASRLYHRVPCKQPARSGSRAPAQAEAISRGSESTVPLGADTFRLLRTGLSIIVSSCRSSMYPKRLPWLKSILAKKTIGCTHRREPPARRRSPGGWRRKGRHRATPPRSGRAAPAAAARPEPGLSAHTAAAPGAPPGPAPDGKLSPAGPAAGRDSPAEPVAGATRRHSGLRGAKLQRLNARRGRSAMAAPAPSALRHRGLVPVPGPRPLPGGPRRQRGLPRHACGPGAPPRTARPRPGVLGRASPPKCLEGEGYGRKL